MITRRRRLHLHPVRLSDKVPWVNMMNGHVKTSWLSNGHLSGSNMIYKFEPAAKRDGDLFYFIFPIRQGFTVWGWGRFWMKDADGLLLAWATRIKD